MASIRRDLIAGSVVFLVALPLCLGIPLASNVPLIAGLIAGVIGGVVVGAISGSATSVSGPAAGLTVIVASQVETLGSLEAFLLAVVIAGALQILMGVMRLGAIAAFCPSGVIEGLLAAIGIILILKQTPHLLGHDSDPEGEMAFQQPDHETTFSEITRTLGDLHLGAAVIGAASLVLLLMWDRQKMMKRTGIPGPLMAVVAGVFGNMIFRLLGGSWEVGASHLVSVPVAGSINELAHYFRFPDFSAITRPDVLVAGVTVAAVASLESLLNLEAVDKLDPQRRNSPPNRELIAQGCGNLLSGLVGGLPITAVIVRGSVNVNAGAVTKLSTIAHGVLLCVAVVLVPNWINMIPLSCLAAVLLQTGCKLASWELVAKMWSRGLSQFLPFLATVLFIVFTDLLIGVVLGLLSSILFILYGNLRRPIHQIHETHVSGEVLRIELPEQVSFLNRAALVEVLRRAKTQPQVLLDARRSEYIDADVLDTIKEFALDRSESGNRVSMIGFKDHYQLQDRIEFVDYTTREVQGQLSPETVLEILQNGNDRFRTGHPLMRDYVRLKEATSQGQFPIAVTLSCIDSRTPVELIFDLALGDIFSVRIAGNVAKEKALASMEYACAVAGAKLVAVLGHTQCGAVGAALDLFISGQSALEATGCEHLDVLTREIQKSIPSSDRASLAKLSGAEKSHFANEVAKHNVMRTVRYIRSESHTLNELEKNGTIAIIGGLHDIRSGQVEFFGGLETLARRTTGIDSGAASRT